MACEQYFSDIKQGVIVNNLCKIVFSLCLSLLSASQALSMQGVVSVKM